MTRPNTLAKPRPSRWWTRSIGLSVAALGLVFGGALCGDRAGLTPQQILQQRACVENIEKGDYEKGETRCQICLEYNERNAECMNAMGLIWYARGNTDNAMEWFRKAIRENNDMAQARNNMASLHFEKGEFEAAADLYNSAVEIDPGFNDGRYNLALTYLRLGQRATAREGGGKGAAEEALKRYEQAETEYRKLFELQPDRVDPYRDMGLIMTYRAALTDIENERRTLLGDAESYFVRCLDLDPTHETCHESYAHTLLVLGRYDKALFHDVQCIAANKNNPICNRELKIAYEGSQLKSESLRRYIEQLAENPGYAMGHYGFCLALFEKGLVDMAVTECENALKLDEGLCLAHYQLGTHYKAVYDKDKAIANCRGLIRCAGAEQYEAEVTTCKEIVRELEVQ